MWVGVPSGAELAVGGAVGGELAVDVVVGAGASTEGFGRGAVSLAGTGPP
jgi:hypothetical protein